MTAFPSPNMMMRRRKTEDQIRQEVTYDLNTRMWGVTQDDIDRVTTERMEQEMSGQTEQDKILTGHGNRLSEDHQ